MNLSTISDGISSSNTEKSGKYSRNQFRGVSNGSNVSLSISPSSMSDISRVSVGMGKF
jgi:hypothetical protein